MEAQEPRGQQKDIPNGSTHVQGGAETEDTTIAPRGFFARGSLREGSNEEYLWSFSSSFDSVAAIAIAMVLHTSPRHASP
jgi:hypothetical protein